jgi:hypothetical protein
VIGPVSERSPDVERGRFRADLVAAGIGDECFGVDFKFRRILSPTEIDEVSTEGPNPLRLIRRIVNKVLAALDGEFAKIYAEGGRPSIAPERLLRGALPKACAV